MSVAQPLLTLSGPWLFLPWCAVEAGNPELQHPPNLVGRPSVRGGTERLWLIQYVASAAPAEVVLNRSFFDWTGRSGRASGQGVKRSSPSFSNGPPERVVSCRNRSPLRSGEAGFEPVSLDRNFRGFPRSRTRPDVLRQMPSHSHFVRSLVNWPNAPGGFPC